MYIIYIYIYIYIYMYIFIYYGRGTKGQNTTFAKKLHHRHLKHLKRFLNTLCSVQS